MAGVRFNKVQSRPTEFLDLTSLTPDEFEQLIPPFEGAFQAHMARWRLDGPAPHANLASTKIAPCPHLKIACSFCSLTLKRTASKWSRDACSAWARAKPISELPCIPLAIPLLALWRPWRNG
jgi:hypothetical protein